MNRFDYWSWLLTWAVIVRSERERERGSVGGREVVKAFSLPYQQFSGIICVGIMEGSYIIKPF